MEKFDLESHLNSVTEINVQDVIEATKNSVSKINSSSYSASSHSQSKIFSQRMNCQADIAAIVRAKR